MEVHTFAAHFGGAKEDRGMNALPQPRAKQRLAGCPLRLTIMINERAVMPFPEVRHLWHL